MTKDSYGYPTKIPTKITDLYGGDDIPSRDEIPSSDDIVEEIEEYLDVDIAEEGQVLTMGADGIVGWDDVASGGTSYSTEETAVGTWIDGKTVYQKSYSTDLTFTAGDSSINLGIADIDTIVSIDGAFKLIKTNGDILFRGFNSKYSSDSTMMNVYAIWHQDNGIMTFRIGNDMTGSDYTSRHINLTLKYTKGGT